MAGRSRSTFGKRQKEMKRLEKRQDKAARKDQRKQEKLSGPGGDQDDLAGVDFDALVRETADVQDDE